MTNLEKLLENDAEKLAELLVKPYYDLDGCFIGYIGPNQILHLAYNPKYVRMNIDYTYVKECIFESGLNPYLRKDKCKDSIIKWFKQTHID